MNVSIISQSNKLPDTYGEWWINYLDNVIMPYFSEPHLAGLEASEKRKAKTKAIEKEIMEMKQHYSIDQPKIEHVEVSFSMQL